MVTAPVIVLAGQALPYNTTGEECKQLFRGLYWSYVCMYKQSLTEINHPYIWATPSFVLQYIMQVVNCPSVYVCMHTCLAWACIHVCMISVHAWSLMDHFTNQTVSYMVLFPAGSSDHGCVGSVVQQLLWGTEPCLAAIRSGTVLIYSRWTVASLALYLLMWLILFPFTVPAQVCSLLPAGTYACM